MKAVIFLSSVATCVELEKGGCVKFDYCGDIGFG